MYRDEGRAGRHLAKQRDISSPGYSKKVDAKEEEMDDTTSIYKCVVTSRAGQCKHSSRKKNISSSKWMLVKGGHPRMTRPREAALFKVNYVGYEPGHF
jgi:hypothetical protein